jgi:hypothetical protein
MARRDESYVGKLLRLRAGVGRDLALLGTGEHMMRGTAWERYRVEEYGWLMKELVRVGVRKGVKG